MLLVLQLRRRHLQLNYVTRVCWFASTSGKARHARPVIARGTKFTSSSPTDKSPSTKTTSTSRRYVFSQHHLVRTRASIESRLELYVVFTCQDPNSRFRNEPPLSLEGASAAVANDYTKRQHVFRLKLVSGADYLLNAKDMVSEYLILSQPLLCYVDNCDEIVYVCVRMR